MPVSALTIGLTMRKDIEKRLKKKVTEKKEIAVRIAGLNAENLAVDAVIAELESILRMMPKDMDSDDDSKDLRDGTEVYLAREVLQTEQKPLHVSVLVEKMGFESTAKRKHSIASQLASYVRRGEVFTRPAPNTFGLFDYGPVPLRPEDAAGYENMMRNAEHEAATQDRDDFDSDLPF